MTVENNKYILLDNLQNYWHFNLKRKQLTNEGNKY
jgi:hypothetical protein